MNTSFEAQLQSDAERRHRLRRILIVLSVAIFLSLAAVWFLITQPLFINRPSVESVNVDPAWLEAHVRRLSEQLVPRDQSRTDNLDRVAEYVRAKFEEAGGTISEQPFEVGGRTYRNVIADFGPDSKERIVVGAHYDAYHSFPGADDNASGVAGLIELAMLLGKAHLLRRVELVAYTLEEPPYFQSAHMGSMVHAESLRTQGVSVKAMLSLEMIGCFKDEPNSQEFPVSLLRVFYPSRGNFISVVGGLGDGFLVRRVKSAMRSASPLPVYSINAPRFVPGVDFSDHLSYWKAGYPAVMITDTAFYRNRNYHTVNDTADKLDYKRMAMVVEGVYAAVLALAR
jgi:Zn-dependent M28 family amino/carboxypeptidase